MNNQISHQGQAVDKTAHLESMTDALLRMFLTCYQDDVYYRNERGFSQTLYYIEIVNIDVHNSLY